MDGKAVVVWLGSKGDVHPSYQFIDGDSSILVTVSSADHLGEGW